MPEVKCRNIQCGHVIAFINGNVREVKCDRCGKVRKLYHSHKRRSIKLTIRSAHRPQREIDTLHS